MSHVWPINNWQYHSNWKVSWQSVVSQFLLDSRFLIPVQIENGVEDQVSWDRKQKFDPWLQDFLIISHRHNTTPHGLFVWATRIETRPSKANFSSCTYQTSFNTVSRASSKCKQTIILGLPGHWAMIKYMNVCNLTNLWLWNCIRDRWKLSRNNGLNSTRKNGTFF